MCVVAWSWRGLCTNEGAIEKREIHPTQFRNRKPEVQPSLSLVKKNFVFCFFFLERRMFLTLAMKRTCCYLLKVWLWSYFSQSNWLSLLHGNVVLLQRWQILEGWPSDSSDAWGGNTMLTPSFTVSEEQLSGCCGCCCPVWVVQWQHGV